MRPVIVMSKSMTVLKKYIDSEWEEDHSEMKYLAVG